MYLLHHPIVRELGPNFSPQFFAFGFGQLTRIWHGSQLRRTVDLNWSIPQDRVDQVAARRDSLLQHIFYPDGRAVCNSTCGAPEPPFVQVVALIMLIHKFREGKEWSVLTCKIQQGGVHAVWTTF
jgi:hypothetical protein